ncbi:MAG: phosphoenolpyruvate mutase [Clostridiales bacterium]|nr:phosphoenolpyruvate mutase [Clostridiales bacterium]
MKQVYICFSTDIIHNGHLSILKKAAALGEVTVGILTDEVVASYKHFPLIPLDERIAMFESLKYVSRVVVQETLDYTDVLEQLRPDIVVHGDDWLVGYQANIRAKVIATLKAWGGELVEFPYTHTPTEETLSNLDALLSLPESRRSRLRRLLGYKPCLSVCEAHNGITGLIVEKTTVDTPRGRKQFDAMWVSSLCDSTAKGKPDIELVDMTSRLSTLEEIMEVTTKPIILDGDTGGQIEHFIYNVQTLERMGVSAIIIEDKKGLKKNSLFGTDAGQMQDSIEGFCAKITAGKNAQKTRDFMIIARCESLILEQGLEDALARCHAYVKAGADGVMIHSKSKTPDEVYAFCDAFRQVDAKTPIIAVPTTYNSETEEQLSAHGINVVIHANHLIRSAFPAMQATARSILENGRSKEADALCMSIKDILTLLPNR